VAAERTVSRDAKLRAAAWAACAATIGLAAAAVVLVALTRIGTAYEPDQSLLSSLADAPITLAYVVVGVVLTLKRPANLVGWALLLAGAGGLLGGVGEAYGELAVLARPEAGLPAGAAAAAIGPGSWTPLIAGVFLLLVTFPSGTIGPGRKRRWVVSVLAAFAAVWVLLTLSPDLEAPLDNVENPLAVPGSKALVSLAIPFIAGGLLSVVAAGVDLVRRFRRSRGIERQQFTWLAASGGLLVVTLPFAAAFNYARVTGLVFTLELIALPISVGIAVLRYRLYEIDVIIRRTLVYGALTAVLAGTYAGVVLGLQAVFSSFAGGSNLAVAVSTLIVATLFLPARRRTQSLVDRRFYRRRYDARQTLEAFGVRLREEVELETLRGDLLGVVGETMEPAHVSVWLRSAPPHRNDPVTAEP
jgi:hypothetical protein